VRILTISNLFPPNVIGGYELLCSQAVDALRARGHRVEVLTAARGHAPAHPDVHRTLRLADVYDGYVHGHSSPMAWRQRELEARLFSAHNAQVLGAHISAFRPDVVYLWNLDGLAGLSLLALLRQIGLPWVWHLQDCVPRVMMSSQGRVNSRMAAACAPLFEGVFVACSEGVVEEIRAGGIEVGPRITHIPNWVIDVGRERTRWFSPGDDALKIIFAGHVTREKGFGILVEAIAELARRGHRNVRLDAHGTMLDPFIPGLIERSGVGSQVILHGWTDHGALLDLYDDHDMFVFPTWPREPFGVAALEAAAHGCVPLISADCGVSEWLLDGVHCLKAMRTPVAFADALERVLIGDDRLEDISRRGRSICARDFHIEVVGGLIEAVLTETASSGTAYTDEEISAAHRVVRVAERIGMAMVAEQHGDGSARRCC
jgi:glycogen(starch) synthase